MPGSAPRGSAVLTHQPPPSPALTPLRSGDAAPGPERLRGSARNAAVPFAPAAFRTRKPSSSSSSSAPSVAFGKPPARQGLLCAGARGRASLCSAGLRRAGEELGGQREK